MLKGDALISINEAFSELMLGKANLTEIADNTNPAKPKFRKEIRFFKYIVGKGDFSKGRTEKLKIYTITRDNNKKSWDHWDGSRKNINRSLRMIGFFILLNHNKVILFCLPSCAFDQLEKNKRLTVSIITI